MQNQEVTKLISKLAVEKGYHTTLVSIYSFKENDVEYEQEERELTQSLIQAWLRTKNIIVFVTPDEVSSSDTKGIRFVWDICDFQGEMLGGDESPLGFLTYEEALEKGLEEGLKLLPNKE